MLLFCNFEGTILSISLQNRGIPLDKRPINKSLVAFLTSHLQAHDICYVFCQYLEHEYQKAVNIISAHFPSIEKIVAVNMDRNIDFEEAEHNYIHHMVEQYPDEELLIISPSVRFLSALSFTKAHYYLLNTNSEKLCEF